ncbi:family 16 glycosylhydrolase [Microbacterium sp. NIBRBAC000506063]|nr:family 16 glycosylhydrolase [Microbacterium sp. NIBRBAC000506063]
MARPANQAGPREIWHKTGYLDQRSLRTGDVSVAQQYGRWEIRAKTPTGPQTYGSLAAFWLRNSQSGEIDIMEAWDTTSEACATSVSTPRRPPFTPTHRPPAPTPSTHGPTPRSAARRRCGRTSTPTPSSTPLVRGDHRRWRRVDASHSRDASEPVGSALFRHTAAHAPESSRRPISPVLGHPGPFEQAGHAEPGLPDRLRAHVDLRGELTAERL